MNPNESQDIARRRYGSFDTVQRGRAFFDRFFTRRSGTYEELLPIPSQTTHSGKYLTTNGSDLSWGTVTGGSGGKSVTFIVGPASNTDSAGYDYTTDGTDDDVQIQSAIDALPATGGTVLLREGTYTLNYTADAAGEINSTKNGVVLRGMGRGTIVKYENGISDSAMMIALTGSNCKVRDIYFDFNLANADGGLGYPEGILSVGANAEVSGCVFHDGAGFCVYADDGTLIDGCVISDFDGTYYDYAITAAAADNIVVNRNLFTTTKTAFFYGVGNVGGSVFIVTNNIMSLPNSSEAGFCQSCEIVIGNYVTTGTSYSSPGGVIEGCTLVKGNVLYLDCDTTLSNLAISECRVVSGNTVGMGSVDSQFTAIQGCLYVYDNNIGACGYGIKAPTVATGNIIYDFGADAITIENDRTTVSNNQITASNSILADNTYKGIVLLSNIDHCVITNNIVRGDSASNDLQYCISEGTSNDYNIIEHNVCTGADTSQINVVGANTISANNITA